jgi:hypothetical protein
MSQVKFGTIQWDALVQVGAVSLTTDVSGVLPVANGGNGTGSYTNGQILIGNTTGNTLAKSTLTGTANQVIVTNGGGSITLSLPQNIHATATPTFAGMNFGTTGSFSVGGTPNFTISATAVNFGFLAGFNAVYTDGANGSSVLNIGSVTNQITVDTANVLYGIQNDVRLNQNGHLATGTLGSVVANFSSSGGSGTSGTITNVLAFSGRAGNFSTGTVTNGYCFYAQQSQNFAGGTLTNWHGFNVEPSTAATNVYGYRGRIASSANRYNLYMDGTADNFLAGNLQLGLLVTKYNNVATVSNGIPSEYATVDLTGQTANIGATTLYAVPSTGAGMYRVSAYVVLTTAASVSSTLPNVQIVFTDNQTNTSITMNATPILGVAGIGQTGALTANTVGTAVSGVIVVNAKASTNIQYSLVNYASSLAGMAYAVHLKLEAM